MSKQYYKNLREKREVLANEAIALLENIESHDATKNAIRSIILKMI